MIPASWDIFWGTGFVILNGFYFALTPDGLPARNWQLARFKANPANQDRGLRTGVWRYTRHPNYFGDAVQWWAYYVIAAAGAFWTL
ncbi:MAG: DUF1295 domain-containing protein [Anaerolineae bacterium]